MSQLAIEQHFAEVTLSQFKQKLLSGSFRTVVLFIILYKVVLTFESEDEIL